MHQDVRNLETNLHHSAVLKLMGVGGGGCNAIEHMVAADIHGLDYTWVNTDAQALARYHPENVIQLGSNLTRGLGAGANPDTGRLAAEEDIERITSAIGNTDLLFLTAGMGGGTGTGAVPVVARIARELGVLTVAVVTRPFAFEGEKRRGIADAGIEKLRREVDSLIVVPNENLLTCLGPDISLIDAFAASNDILTNAVQSIAELITTTGLINVDFADVKSVMTETGQAMMSTGRGIGEHRARDAAIAAIESPLLDDIDLRDARGILANVTASADLSMGDFQIVGDIIANITAADANVVIGTVFDQRMKDEIRVTVVATGLNSISKRSITTAATVKRKRSLFGVKTSATKTGPDTPASAIKANKPSPGKQVCYICESPRGVHSMQCPLREYPASVTRQTVEKRPARSNAGARVAGRSVTSKISKKVLPDTTALSNERKLSVVGLLVGVLVLVAIFHPVTGKKIVDGFNQLAGNEHGSKVFTIEKRNPPDQQVSRIE